MRRISDGDYRLLKKLLERNTNNSPPRGRVRGGDGRRTEKTKYLNSGLRRVYLNTDRNRHFVYSGQANRKTRAYTETFAYKNNWNQVKRIASARRRSVTVSPVRRRRPQPHRNYRDRY